MPQACITAIRHGTDNYTVSKTRHCLSSVCHVPTQAIEIFRNVSTPFNTLAIC